MATAQGTTRYVAHATSFCLFDRCIREGVAAETITATGRKVSEIIDDASICRPQRDEKVTINQQKKKASLSHLLGNASARSMLKEKKAKEDSSSQNGGWNSSPSGIDGGVRNKMSHFRSLLRSPGQDQDGYPSGSALPPPSNHPTIG